MDYPRRRWTIRVGVGGRISNRGYDKARDPAGASSVSNDLAEVVLVPGGGAGGSRSKDPTVGAVGGGGGNSGQSGAQGNYTNSIGGALFGPYSGGIGLASDKSKDLYGYGGGGGGASESGDGRKGGEGLASDITGIEVIYGSGGGGGAQSRVYPSSPSKQGIAQGGEGGTNAGSGGTCRWDVIDNGATTENGAVFNLQGQKVNKAQKGVYIINNKKVVVK